ncbi:MAG: hypothetical protein ACTSUE_07655 [Promethearchaeota archaeon]
MNQSTSVEVPVAPVFKMSSRPKPVLKTPTDVCAYMKMLMMKKKNNNKNNKNKRPAPLFRTTASPKKVVQPKTTIGVGTNIFADGNVEDPSPITEKDIQNLPDLLENVMKGVEEETTSVTTQPLAAFGKENVEQASKMVRKRANSLDSLLLVKTSHSPNTTSALHNIDATTIPFVFKPEQESRLDFDSSTDIPFSELMDLGLGEEEKTPTFFHDSSSTSPFDMDKQSSETSTSTSTSLSSSSWLDDLFTSPSPTEIDTVFQNTSAGGFESIDDIAMFDALHNIRLDEFDFGKNTNSSKKTSKRKNGPKGTNPKPKRKRRARKMKDNTPVRTKFQPYLPTDSQTRIDMEIIVNARPRIKEILSEHFRHNPKPTAAELEVFKTYSVKGELRIPKAKKTRGKVARCKCCKNTIKNYQRYTVLHSLCVYHTVCLQALVLKTGFSRCIGCSNKGQRRRLHWRCEDKLSVEEEADCFKYMVSAR